MRDVIRDGMPSDLPEILRIDRLVVGDQAERSDEIIHAIENGICRILVSDSEIVAFAIFTPKSFRSMDFLNLLVVHPAQRRLGHATSLLFDFQLNATSHICWTSTNASNSGMIELLCKSGWVDSGYSEELDVDDPDLFYSYDRKNVPVTLVD